MPSGGHTRGLCGVDAGTWRDVKSIYPAGWTCPFAEAEAKQKRRSGGCNQVQKRRYALPESCPDLGRRQLRLLEGRAVFFLGDSMAGQHSQALFCRLLLHKYSLIGQGPAPWAQKLHAPMKAPKHCTPAGQMTSMSKCKAFLFEGSQQARRNITVCNIMAGLLGSRCTSISTAARVKALLSGGIAARGDLLIANEGVWLTDRDKGFTDVRAAETRVEHLASVWREHGRDSGVHLFWRETGPQHFETPDGRFNRSHMALMGTAFRCMPHGRTARPAWEQRARLEPLEEAGATVVRVWNLSASQWDVHTAGLNESTDSRDTDCTHYCEPSGMLEAWVDATLVTLDKASVEWAIKEQRAVIRRTNSSRLFHNAMGSFKTPT